MKKKIIISSIVLIVLIAVIGVALFFYSRTLSYEGVISGTNDSEILITRDVNRTPVITALSESDIYYGLGVVHAQDRILLMEYFRSISIGRSEKYIGPDGLYLNNLITAVGIQGRANTILEKIDFDSRKNITAYVNGINSVTYSNKKHPDNRWQESHVISILLLREWTNAFLNNYELKLNLPEENKNSKIKKMVKKGSIFFYKKENKKNRSYLKKINNLIKKYIGCFNRGYAFSISGKNRKGGNSISGFSFDNSISVYPSFYPVHIKYNSFTLKGLTMAGLPFLFSGDNGKLTFYGFSLDTDTQSFYIKDIKKVDDELLYRVKSRKWKKFIVRREPSGSGNKIVWDTEFGPVIDDIFEENENRIETLIINSIFPEENYITSLFKIPFLENLKEAEEAVRRIDSLPRVYLFVSPEKSLRIVSGKISSGKRNNYLFQGKNSVPSKRYIDFIDLWKYKFKTDKNNYAGNKINYKLPERVIRKTVSGEIQFKRLKELSEKSKFYSDRDVKEILLDTYSIPGKVFIPPILKLLKHNPTTSARLIRIYFNKWNSKVEENNVSITIFSTLLRNFIAETYVDKINLTHSEIYNNYLIFIDNFYKEITNSRSTLFDDSRTENVESAGMIFDRALIKTMRTLNRRLGPVFSKWRWGRINRGHYNIPIRGRSIMKNFNYQNKNQVFLGDPTTLFNTVSNYDFILKRSTSIVGFFGKNSSSIYKNFNYCLDNFSEYHYGEEKLNSFIEFYKPAEKYSLSINPK